MHQANSFNTTEFSFKYLKAFNTWQVMRMFLCTQTSARFTPEGKGQKILPKILIKIVNGGERKKAL